MNREELVRVAKGEVPADLVIQKGTLVNVNSAEVYPADVAVKGDRIAAVGDVAYTIGRDTRIVDAANRYLCPGLIETHMHVGGSQLSMTQFARAVLKRGTTALSTDFYEVGVVAGLRGIRFVVDELKKTPLKVLFTIPLHHYLGHGPFGNTNTIAAQDLHQMLDWPECVGLAEWNVFLWDLPDPVIREVTRAAWRKNKLVAGHLAQIPTKLVQATAALGVYSDHEAATAEEALEKARAGVHIQMREGSAARDLQQVIRAVHHHRADPRHFSFCTDEQEADGLAHDGHIDHKVRMAVASGVAPITAIQMASLNAAEYFGVAADLGSIAPGKIADVVVVDDLAKFNVVAVIANGVVVAREGHSVSPIERPDYPPYFFKTVKLQRTTTPDDFAIAGPTSAERTARARVIGVTRGSLVTECRELRLPVEVGNVIADVEQDVVKVAVIDRHQRSGRIGRGFVQGLGIKGGAVGSTFSPGLMNIVVAGTNDRDMSVVASRIAELDGGYVVARDGRVLAELALPMLGIFSDEPLEHVVEKLDEVNQALRNQIGTDFPGLYTALGFICLPVSIPALKICEMGLVDVTQMAVVDVCID